MNDTSSKKAGKILLIFLMIVGGFCIFLGTIFYHIFADRKLPNLQAKRIESAIRGSIYSSDGFLLASSKKVYKAVVNTYNIDPQKKELFINLFSIYSKIPKQEIAEKLQDKGNVVLSYDIDSKTASYLKQLSIKLNALDVFRAYENENGHIFKYGLSVVESGESRDYLYEDTMEPILGYINKQNQEDITKVSGVKGIEKSFNEELEPLSDLLMVGQRDIGFNVILNKDSTFKERSDGYNVISSIPLKLQKKIEQVIDDSRKILNAKEIIVGIMESKTGKMISLASSARFNPNVITKEDYPNLNANAIEYSYEPGSVIKPIIYSILLDKKLIEPSEIIPLENGRYKLHNFYITDTHRLQEASIEEILLYSSNIGMAKIAQRLMADEYYEGLKAFGFGEKSGIDLPYERVGVIPDIRRLRSEVYRATVSYGYGLRTTFMQMLKAYNTIVNDGVAYEPYLVEYIQDSKGVRYKLKHQMPTRILSDKVANEVKNTLIKVVTQGTGRTAQVKGVTIGGKTGTAHIAQGGQYVRKYNSSFFGFVSDEKGNEYTIGISVFEPNETEAYFASITAVPLFKEIVELLIKENYLYPLNTQ
ncbi:peptidoglycan D,D-transpeptidase FtsI family protein [Helicobacter pullorum]|uniref:Penicillin-binding protein, transpeptidase domain protein n=2 Tax=Helicobacter pullorum TaxID=35818 RepID=C5F032_9HELI|nr:penicillin-binding protein 2 [Helicobacter pullorum]EEQ63626.1 penicillin-binding protein, transpeptidase domain protein [Helicobacter pullorum MIT 98-5489]KAB0575302.1 penicillin-binding protein 2 [Helicobacter pullorum NCTC 12824]KPH52942.1 penicillin-binding protein [Helicobacter pullorum]OCR06170.1 penicillin-binding protein [Helicobacter pullorum]OCR14905.1 penicillin-binding protein [Helicobacter pullorum]